MKKTLIITILMMALPTVAYEANAKAVEYKVKKNSGIQTYYTHYAYSKKWLIECTRQTSGRKLGKPHCDLSPASGKIYPRSGIRGEANFGVNVRLERISLPKITFIPANMRANQSYSIKCLNTKYTGAYGSRRSSSAFKGTEAKDILDDMMEASGCALKFVNFGKGYMQGNMQTIGLTDAVEFANEWLEKYPN